MKGKDFIKRDIFLNLIDKKEQDIDVFFLNQDYRKLSSYPKDEPPDDFYSLLLDIIISEYENYNFENVFHSLNDKKLKNEISNHFSFNSSLHNKSNKSSNNNSIPINIALLFISEDFFKLDPQVIRIPFENGVTSEDSVLNYLNNVLKISNYIIAKSNLIENIYENEHSLDIPYYIYTDQIINLISILELENIEKKDILVLNNYLKSFETMFIDEDILKKIKTKRKILLKSIGK